MHRALAGRRSSICERWAPRQNITSCSADRSVRSRSHASGRRRSCAQRQRMSNASGRACAFASTSAAPRPVSATLMHACIRVPRPRIGIHVTRSNQAGGAPGLLVLRWVCAAPGMVYCYLNEVDPRSLDGVEVPMAAGCFCGTPKRADLATQVRVLRQRARACRYRGTSGLDALDFLLRALEEEEEPLAEQTPSAEFAVRSKASCHVSAIPNGRSHISAP